MSTKRNRSKTTLKTLIKLGSVVLATATTLIACGPTESVPKPSPTEHLPGGATTVSTKPFASYMRPVDNLPQAQKPDFHAGKALANQPWVKAPTVTTARDGLGPIYNARTCLACHINGGRSQMPSDGNSVLFGPVLKLSLPGADRKAGAVPEPVYGDQLQTQSVALSHQLRQHMPPNDPAEQREVAPEAYVYINWQTHTFTYPDGQQRQLRRPLPRLDNLGYGELHPDTLMGLRNAPAIHGVGLLELIEAAAIEQLADPDDHNQDGISGRINQVWDQSQQRFAPGRFGWKANRASLDDVTAAAFVNDVGITSPAFPQQPCSQQQNRCLQTPNGNDGDGVELPQQLLDLTVNFVRNLGVPKRRQPQASEVLSGREHFYQTGCASCHQPSFVTGASAEQPHLGGQTIWPYSDLLLHDMGPELADNRPDFAASGSEWRTAPLWGVGLSQTVNGSRDLLHDGRAQSVEEAILWHGGEAESARQRFIQLPESERQSLITFVESL